MAALSLRDVRKSYRDQEVVHGVSMEVADGEFMVIVGPSGCGKSTLLRMVAGLETISSGEIRIGSRVVNGLEPKDRDIAMVFQNYALYPHMSVYENMSYGLRIRGMPASEIAARVERIGAPLEVYARPASTFVAAFIGSPPMNLIPQERDGRKILFGVRPEHLEPCAEADALLMPEIDLIEPLGADTLVYGHLPGQGVRIAARMHASAPARAGRLPLRYRPADAHSFDAA